MAERHDGFIDVSVRGLVPTVNEMVLAGNTLKDSVTSVSKKHGVTYAALRKAYQRQPTLPRACDGNKKLDPNHEQALLYVAQTFVMNNRALSTRDIQELVPESLEN